MAPMLKSLLATAAVPLGTVKRIVSNRQSFRSTSAAESVTQAGAQQVVPLTEVAALQAELRRAELDELALEHRLHRVRDPDGMGMLRKLRGRILTLRGRLGSK